MTVVDKMKAHIGQAVTNSPSAVMNWLQPKVLHAEKGHLQLQYVVRNEWANPMGNLHGGISAAIIDDCIGATVATLEQGYFFTTINNVIDYLSAAQVHDLIIAETRIVKKGKQFIHAHCDIWNADRSRILVRGTSILFKTDIEKA